MNTALLEPKKDLELKSRGNKMNEVKAIIDSIVYGQQTNDNYQMPDFYYLVLWKGYPKEEDIWESSFAVIYLWKFINTFYKKHLEKPIATSSPLDSTPLMARLMVQKEPK